MNLRELAEALFLPIVGTVFELAVFQPIQDRMVAGRAPAEAAPPAAASGKAQNAAGQKAEGGESTVPAGANDAMVQQP